MKKTNFPWLLFLFLLISIPATANPLDFSELDKLVPEELKERNTPGAVIAIVSGDRVVYKKAFGLASGETLRKSLNKAMELGLGLKEDAPATPAPVPPLTTAQMEEVAEPIRTRRRRGKSPSGTESSTSKSTETSIS